MARKKKDLYSQKNPRDQAKLYYSLNKAQDEACDDMNDAANKLHDMGIKTSFSWW